MATMDDGEQKHHRRYHTKLNYIEEVSPSYIVSIYNLICFLIFQALIHKFQKYFMACFDVKKMATPEDIRIFLMHNYQDIIKSPEKKIVKNG